MTFGIKGGLGGVKFIEGVQFRSHLPTSGRQTLSSSGVVFYPASEGEQIKAGVTPTDRLSIGMDLDDILWDIDRAPPKRSEGAPHRLYR
jgi:O-acetylhomoserine/O-acetylserine sulfhydrylase-like pyridoxal-dependent enzyme